MNALIRLVPSLTLCAALSSTAGAQEWTRFRGPNGAGHGEAKGLPVQWTETDFVWRTAIPGVGHGQPVVWGGRIFLLSANPEGTERMVIGLDKATGKILWKASVPMSGHKKHKDNSFASTTPAVDAERVYAVFASPEEVRIRAFDHDGKEVWGGVLGAFQSEHGHATSPILHEGKVIVQMDHISEGAVVALDAKTGKKVWTCPRRGDEKSSFSTPCVWEPKGGAPELLTASTAYGLSGIDLRTGKLLWEARLFDKRSCSSPVVAGNLVIGTCGDGGGKANTIAAVKLGGKGDVTASHLAWKSSKSAPYVPTPLVVGERVFLLHDKGFIACAEAATGNLLWNERLGGGFYGSLVHADGRLYGMSMQGEALVLDAGGEFRILAKNPLLEGSHSTPCVDGGRLYLRTFGHLICVGGK